MKEKKSKKEELNDKLTELERNFGLERTKHKEVEIIKTGIYALDYVIDGIKLVEGGHKIEFYGRESSGKTTFAKKTVAEYQRQGKICVWIVSESFHEGWAKKMGVDTDKLLKYYPESVEDACDKILEIVSHVDLIVVDSVASIIAEVEIDKTMSEKSRAPQASAYSQFCRKLYKVMAHETTTLLFINQIRIVMGKLFGNPEDTPGGKALKFMYDTRIEFRAGKPIKKKIKGKEVSIGVETNLQGYKNKLGTAKRKAIVDFYYEDGRIDNNKSLFFGGLNYGVIELAGKTYSYNNKKAVGKDKFIALLSEKDYKDIAEEIFRRMK